MTFRRAVFLDRDGVLNVNPCEHGYVQTAAELVLLEGAASAVHRLHEAGFIPVVVSNQRGIARGLVTRETLREIERVIMAAAGCPIAFYYCPHDHADNCSCRKAAPGLLTRAAADLRLDLGQSVMVGDRESDIKAGRAAGVRTVLIAPVGTETNADAVVASLAAAAQLLLRGVESPH